MKAWLVCSLRYQTYNLPIEWVQENAMSTREITKALDYIRTELVHQEKFKAHIPNQHSRELISKYISELSDRIKVYNKV